MKYYVMIGSIFLFISFAEASTTSTDELELSPYKKYIAGHLSLPMKINRHGEFHLGINVAPSFGIFILNNFEQRVQFSITSNYVFSQQEKLVKPPLFWDLSWASIYYFQLRHLWLYAGAGLGVGFMDFNIYSINILIEMPLGILIELDKNLAIDVGIPLRVRVSPRAFFDTFEFPIGVIGIRYLFN